MDTNKVLELHDEFVAQGGDEHDYEGLTEWIARTYSPATSSEFVARCESGPL